jgi:hypothetical protein
MFSLLNFRNPIQNHFRTRLGFNKFRFKFAFNNTIPCTFDLALTHHHIAHDSYAYEYNKFVQQILVLLPGNCFFFFKQF